LFIRTDYSIFDGSFPLPALEFATWTQVTGVLNKKQEFVKVYYDDTLVSSK
jgi:hypothetical protein